MCPNRCADRRPLMVVPGAQSRPRGRQVHPSIGVVWPVSCRCWPASPPRPESPPRPGSRRPRSRRRARAIRRSRPPGLARATGCPRRSRWASRPTPATRQPPGGRSGVSRSGVGQGDGRPAVVELEIPARGSDEATGDDTGEGRASCHQLPALDLHGPSPLVGGGSQTAVQG